MENIKVAIVDSGIKDVVNGITIFYDGEKKNKYDDDYDIDLINHGTLVANIYKNFNKNVELYSVKIFHDELTCTIEELIAAIEWCIEKEVNVLNISCGFKENNIEDRELIEKLKIICEKACLNGIIIVASQIFENTLLPAKFDNIISVKSGHGFNNHILYDFENDNIIANGKWYFKIGEKTVTTLGSSYATAYVGSIIAKNLKTAKKYDEIITMLSNYNYGLINKVGTILNEESCIYIHDRYTYNILKNYLKSNINIKYNVSKIFLSNIVIGDEKNSKMCINNRITDIDCYSNDNIKNYKNIIILSFEENVDIYNQLIEFINLKKNCFLFGDFKLDKFTLTKISNNVIDNKCILYLNESYNYSKNNQEKIVFVHTGFMNDLYEVEKEFYEHNENKVIVSTNKGMELLHCKNDEFNEVINREFIFYYKNLIKNNKDTSDYKENIKNFVDIEADRVVIVANLNDNAEKLQCFVGFINCITGKNVSAIYLTNNLYDIYDLRENKYRRLFIDTQRERTTIKKEIQNNSKILNIPIIHDVQHLKFILP